MVVLLGVEVVMLAAEALGPRKGTLGGGLAMYLDVDGDVQALRTDVSPDCC